MTYDNSFERGRHLTRSPDSPSTHAEKAVALASKISAKAEETLAGIEREMRIMKWPDEFRAIMWEAISDAATIRANEVRKS